MTLFYRLRTWLLAIGLIHLALPLRAAELDRKYLLDDAHLVVTVNVQKALASPAYQKHYQAQVETLLKADLAQAVIKDLGFDPLKDIDRITLVAGLSCYRDEPQMENGQVVGFDSQAGPYFIVQGRFDAAKLDAKVKQLVPGLKVHEVGAAKLYELSPKLLGGMPLFAAVVDAKTVVIARFKEQVTVALDKAAGKKKTTITDKVLAGLLTKLDTDQVVAAAASGEMIAGTHTTVTNNNGQVVATVKRHALKEEGIDGVLASLRVADDIKGQVTLTVNDADKAKNMAQMIDAGVQMGIAQIKRLIEAPNQGIEPKHLAPWLNVMQSVTVKAQDNQIVLEGKAGGDIVGKLLQSFLALRNPAPPVPPPAPEP
jgi:hypothetical protein